MCFIINCFVTTIFYINTLQYFIKTTVQYINDTTIKVTLTINVGHFMFDVNVDIFCIFVLYFTIYQTKIDY